MKNKLENSLVISDRIRIDAKLGRWLPAGLQGSHGTVQAFQPPDTTDCFVRVVLDEQEQDWRKGWQLVAVCDVVRVSSEEKET